MSLKCPNCNEGLLPNSENAKSFICDSCDTKLIHEGNSFVIE